jgi:hypothetical protein
MIGELTNHLWQSTLVAGAACLLILMFRRERAEARYWLWLGASCKFLLPFSVLMALGKYFAPISAARALSWVECEWANRPTFESASIQACPTFRRNTPDGWSPGRLRSQCTTVQRLIEQAYGLPPSVAIRAHCAENDGEAYALRTNTAGFSILG